ncbi:hypothetical protein [Rhizomonospora bruguierae]|uniref:hypothetical protein n=1 Tax=Rhizomonospora bruguierae TaxID=1581705 RepID=UPI001BD03917|nr:hypothetical protein [Micromonospora sp. NBRC 107566]
MRSRRPLATTLGGVLLIVSLLVCGVGGGVLLGPVSRSGQDVDLASTLGGKGSTIFDMYEGDEYWIYQPVEQTWPDTVPCNVYDSPEDSWLVRRSERPAAAPERITHFDTRSGTDGVADYDFGYYGTLRGDRTKAFLSVECSPTDFLVVPSRAPQRHLLAVGIVGGLIAAAGVVVLVTGLVRRRRAGAPPAQPAPVPSAPAPPAPVAVGAGGPSRRWYLLVIPPVVLAVLACCAGGVLGLSFGFLKTFDPPNIGTERRGMVSRVLGGGTDYALYADRATGIPDRAACVVRERDSPRVVRWRTGRPIGDPETVTYNGHTYTYVGTFRVNDSVIGTVDCEGESSLLLRHSRRSWPLVWGAVTVASLALVAAAAAGLTTAIRRRRATAAPTTTVRVVPPFR